MQKLKIAQMVGSELVGGAETMMLRLTEQLLNRNENAVVVCRPTSFLIDACRERCLPVVTLPDAIMRYWSNPINLVPYSMEFYRFLRQHNIDVLHSHLFKCAVQNAVAARLAKVKHIATLHDSFTITEKPSRRKWLRASQWLGTRLVGVSQSVCDTVGLPDMQVIYNGVSIDNTVRFIRKDDRPVLLYVGRLVALKRVDVLLKALAQANMNLYQNKKFRLLVVGTGEEKSNLKQLVNDLNLHDDVEMVGFIHDVSAYYGQADVFVLPSSTEGLSMSILEAQAHGLPTVAFNVGGNRELVNAQTGILIDCRGSESPVEKLAQTLLSWNVCYERFRKRLGVAARQQVTDRFSVQRMVCGYQQLFGESL